MPIEKVQESLVQQQLHNEQVKKNIAHIERLTAEQSITQLIESLKQWQESPVLNMTNTLFWSIITLSSLVICILVFLPLPSWLWLFPIALLFFGFYKKENNTLRNQLIERLTIWALQHRYKLSFNSELADYTFIELKHAFPLFSLGNYDNDITDGVTGIFQVNDQAYPFCLFRYHYVDELSSTDDDGRTTYHYEHADRWGVFITGLPYQGITISSQQKRACRLQCKWTTSDIQFNKQYQLSGNHEMNLAQFFTPPRILALDKMMSAFKGDLYLHPQHPVMCWLFQTNLFNIQPKTKNITNTLELAELLEQTSLPEFKKLATVLIPLLEKFDAK